MPSRYQPPMITGGGRNSPTWSELLEYYLPRQINQDGSQAGQNRLPLLSQLGQQSSSLPDHYRALYSRPLEPARDRGTRPSPWQGGGSSYDEIMRRLHGRPIQTEPMPTEPVPSAAPQQPPAMGPAQPPPTAGYPGVGTDFMREMRNLQRY